MKFNRSVTESRRKVHKALYTADAETRAKLMSSRLSKELREKHGVKTMGIRKNDTVQVMTGSHKVTGKVVAVHRGNYKVFVEGAVQKNKGTDSKTIYYPISPSNCMITELYMNGSRSRILARRGPKKAKK